MQMGIYTLNKEAFFQALHKRGFKSASQLSTSIGAHRNSLSHYLKGGSVIPEILERALALLNMDPTSILKLNLSDTSDSTQVIAELSDQIAQMSPQSCVVLFGSRARGRPKPFSDFDLGVYAKGGLPFRTLSLMLSLVDQWNNSTMKTAQLTNLSEADRDFLREISTDLIFTSGSSVAWNDLQARIKEALNAR